MELYIVGIAWSQTDHENVLVSAKNRNDAEAKVKKTFPGIHHTKGATLINHMILG